MSSCLLAQLYSEQHDCFNEIIKFLGYADRYYLLYFLSVSRDEEQVDEILNRFGMELMKSRMEIYRRVLNCIEGMIVEEGSKSNWIVDVNQYRKLLQLYRNIPKFEELKENSLKENKTFIIYQLELLGLRLKSVKTLFHIFREMINFERELLESSLPKYDVGKSPSVVMERASSLTSTPLRLNIGIIGLPKSGKSSLLCSYCTNYFPEDGMIEKASLFEANIMIDGCVIMCTMQSMSLSNEKIVQEVIKQPFDVVAFTCKCTELNNLVNDEQLFEKHILQNLRKLVMNFPLIPIHIIITGKDLDAYSLAGQLTLERKFHNFPHLVQIGYCSSLTQQGLKSVFDEMYRSAMAFRFHTFASKKKNCSLQ